MNQSKINEMLEDKDFRPQLIMTAKDLSKDIYLLKGNFEDATEAAIYYANQLNDKIKQSQVQKDSKEYQEFIGSLTFGFQLLKDLLDQQEPDIMELEIDKNYVVIYVNKFLSFFYNN